METKIVIIQLTIVVAASIIIFYFNKFAQNKNQLSVLDWLSLNNINYETLSNIKCELHGNRNTGNANVCELILTDEALVILGEYNSKLFSSKLKPIVLTNQIKTYKGLIKFGWLNYPKKINFNSYSDSIFIEFGTILGTYHLSIRLIGVDTEFKEKIQKSFSAGLPPTHAKQAH